MFRKPRHSNDAGRGRPPVCVRQTGPRIEKGPRLVSGSPGGESRAALDVRQRGRKRRENAWIGCDRPSGYCFGSLARRVVPPSDSAVSCAKETNTGSALEELLDSGLIVCCLALVLPEPDIYSPRIGSQLCLI